MMSPPFKNRRAAGRLLAAKLSLREAVPADALVLGLPRGGVPVAAEVARTLHLPLDVFVVRKLGVPGHPELAMGAIAAGDVRVLSPEVVDALDLPDYLVNATIVREQEELARREQLYRHGMPPPCVTGRPVVAIDDGIATGSTMQAAAMALTKMGASRVILATPVAARTTLDWLAAAGHEVICVIAPEEFLCVGSWYADFPQTTDQEVLQALAPFRDPVAYEP